MKIGHTEIKLDKRTTLSGWEAARISILAIFFALALLSLLFFLAGVNPLIAYKEIFTYAFANPFGLPLTINRSIFLLFCTFAFIIPYKANLWNIGMTGQLYAGAICAFGIVVLLGGKEFGAQPSAWLLIPLMLIAVVIGGAALGAIAGVLKGKFTLKILLGLQVVTSRQELAGTGKLSLCQLNGRTRKFPFISRVFT
jgi:simple sugar transport system permease protein